MDNIDLKSISTVLSNSPFNKRYSVIQLHDEVKGEELVQLVFQVAAYLDEANKLSTFNIENYPFEENVNRLFGFLKMLNFEESNLIESFVNSVFELKREPLMSILFFFCKDLHIHKKRAYLSVFLSSPFIPPEFAHDEAIVGLIKEIEAAQEDFKVCHIDLDRLKESGFKANDVKRDIQKMEEERQQLLSKISKLQKRVESVPKPDQWLETGKNMRLEQINQMSIEERTQEQKFQISSLERKTVGAKKQLKIAKDSLENSSADSVFSKLEEENKMNKFLATSNLPKLVTDADMRIKDLNEILGRETISDSDIAKIEKEIQETNQLNSQLAEKSLKSNSNGDANLALFRQQASIIAAKKEGALNRLNQATKELNELQQKLGSVDTSEDKKMLIGDDFKKYVSELRGKSTLFKRKKAEFSSISTELGILDRTRQILQNKETGLLNQIKAFEQKHGISGYHEAQSELEKVSELKSQKDQEKGEQLQELSNIVQKLVAMINEKKSLLAPVIQNLRCLRQEAQDLQEEYDNRKREYDATMYGIDSHRNQLNEEVNGLRSDIQEAISKYFYTNQLIHHAVIAQDRVMNEMKAYIGSDEMIEIVQKARGFKTYRDLYNKKIQEGENALKYLKTQQKEIKAKHEPSIRQIEMFNATNRLLALKMEHNNRILSGKAVEEVGVVTQDRLVL